MYIPRYIIQSSAMGTGRDIYTRQRKNMMREVSLLLREEEEVMFARH